MSDVVHVDDDNFETEVLKSEVPVLVDFSAVWCGPCQRLSPIVEKFATENVGKIKVCKVDVDDAPSVTAKMGVRGVPSLVVFQKGISLGNKVGLISLAEMTNFVMTKIGS
jgi:thioredoxin 1